MTYIQDDPQRPDHTAFLGHRIKITKTKISQLEAKLYRYTDEAGTIGNVMDKFIRSLVVYSVDEAGETGSLLRTFARLLRKANSCRRDRVEMLRQTGENMRYLKQVYRKARQTLQEYNDTKKRLNTARQRFDASSFICLGRKVPRAARESLVRTESDLLAKKEALKKQIDEFDMELRAALKRFFFEFVKCEMIMAARVLETYSECNKRLERLSKDFDNESKEFSKNDIHTGLL